MSFTVSGGGSGSSSIAGSSDVALNNPANTQILTFDSTLAKWKNATAPTSGATPTYANLPAGTNISVDYNGSTYPARPTARTDVVVIWRGPTQPPSMLNNDEWKVTA